MAPPLSICTDLTELHDVLYESTLHTNSNRNLVENGMDTLTIKKEGVQNIGRVVFSGCGEKDRSTHQENHFVPWPALGSPEEL